ncbi:MAG: hypothetical protein GXO48_07165 [Chlorobi bacterium]|nr:hypothetical protein [Chlorobiota bacterium]
MKRIGLLLTALILGQYSFAQTPENNSNGSDETIPINWFIEAYPSFYGLGRLKGGAVSVHKTIPCWNNFTAGIGLRYFDGVKSEEDRPGELDITSPRTLSLELFARYWLISRFYAIYIGGLGGIHYSLRPYIGAGVGGYLHIAGPVYLSGALFIQTRSIERGAEPLLPRFFGGIAFQIK